MGSWQPLSPASPLPEGALQLLLLHDRAQEPSGALPATWSLGLPVLGAAALRWCLSVENLSLLPLLPAGTVCLALPSQASGGVSGSRVSGSQEAIRMCVPGSLCQSLDTPHSFWGRGHRYEKSLISSLLMLLVILYPGFLRLWLCRKNTTS